MFLPLRSFVIKAGAGTTRRVLRGVQVGSSPTSSRATRLTCSRSLHCLTDAVNRNGSSSWLAKQHSQVRTVFIQTENTPNPESIKFVPSGRIVLESEDASGFFVQKNDSMKDILKSPLATQLFKIDGVKAVYLGYDFVTITKYAENNWWVDSMRVHRLQNLSCWKQVEQ